jgi:hypothetical protein
MESSRREPTIMKRAVCMMRQLFFFTNELENDKLLVRMVVAL